MPHSTVMDIVRDVEREVVRAMKLHAPMASSHEAHSVILEELDELWLEIKKKRRRRSPKKLRKEAIQVAAMAVRYVHDVVEPGNRK